MCNPPIRYHEIAELPGVKMFRCLRQRAILAVKACVAMWGKANKPQAPEHLERCRNCQTGAEHAGFKLASTIPLRGTSLCVRCRRSGMRLIRGHLCVSCANREYEYLKGWNARGTAPVRHPELGRHLLCYRSGDDVATLTRDRVTGVGELMIAALRDDRRQVAFALHPVGVRACRRKGKTAMCEKVWHLEPHVCRVCQGRIVSTSCENGGRVYQCSGECFRPVLLRHHLAPGSIEPSRGDGFGRCGCAVSGKPERDI